MSFKITIPIIFISVLLSCSKKNSSSNEEWIEFCVTATAYNSLVYQTNDNPHITAFGDSLLPGKRYIAVSRDLLKTYLPYNTPVKIEGLDSLYYVKDKMHYRWKNRIDIYMGTNVTEAKKWGRRRVNISFPIQDNSLKK